MLEDRLSDDEHTKLCSMLRDQPELIDTYVEYIHLHGLLYWESGALTTAETQSALAPALASANTSDTDSRSWQQNSRARLTVLVVVLLVLAGGLFVAGQQNDHQIQVANSANQDNPEDANDHLPTEAVDTIVADNENTREITPLNLDNFHHDNGTEFPVVVNEVPSIPEFTPWELPNDFSDSDIVNLINRELQEQLEENDIAPSPRATDDEWLRRAYLTFAGRIPTVSESNSFYHEPEDQRRLILIRQLADSPWRSRNLAQIWTNLLIGRTSRPGVNRESLQTYLNDQFEQNRPWIDLVGDLVSATGRNDRNGATNFLLAHLNNEATPATAVTARLFLGEQIHCVQCHDHPFVKGIDQREYWALNAFFQQTDRITEVADAYSPSNAMQSSGRYRLVKLVDQPRGGMTFYENLRGQELAVLPEYDGQRLSADSGVNRREKLVEFLKSDSEHRVARAMVNRMWAHFFGYGFTSSVDEVGAHVPTSHPSLLHGITEAFVASDYDLQRLMTWISMTDAWHRSSTMTTANSEDRPEHGSLALFSRVYTRRMTPEQVYESVRVAIRTAANVPIGTEEDDDHRTEWVRQFIRAYETDENDESENFDGTIAQALVMMNDTDVSDAISQAAQVIVSTAGPRNNSGRNRPGNRVTSMDDTLLKLSTAIVTRQPTEREKKVFRQRIRDLSSVTSSEVSMPMAVEDMMWAYLNSSEFIMVH